MSTPKQVLEMAKKAGAKMVDVKFVDTFGTWQHFTLPFNESNVDQRQAQGSRRHPVASAPLRVLPLLRCVRDEILTKATRSRRALFWSEQNEKTIDFTSARCAVNNS